MPGESHQHDAKPRGMLPAADPATVHQELRTWLRAVTDIAGAVTLHQPLSALLDLLARSGGELMGYDFCAVLLANESEGMLEISGSYGLSAEYESQVSSSLSFRLGPQPSGETPSSRAFLTGLPVAVEDVLRDPSFRPWGRIAKKQGIGSLIAVPLMVNGRAVGTLNGYRSKPHHFEQDEVLLLGALANLAGTAIETARLREHEQATIGQLQTLNSSLRAQARLLQQAEEIHQRLTAVALGSGGVQALVSVLAGLLDRPVLVEDAALGVLAMAVHQGATVDAPPASERTDLEPALDTEGGLIEVPPWPGARPYLPRISVPVFLDEELVARFWMPGRAHDLGALQRRAIEHAVVVSALQMIRERTALDVEWALRGDLLAELLADNPSDSVTLIPRARHLGHDLSQPHTVLVIRADLEDGDARSSTSSEQRRILGLVRTAAQSTASPALATISAEYVVMLWPLPRKAGDLTSEEVAESIRKHVSKGGSRSTISVAVGEPCQDLTGYAQAFRRQRGALELARLQGYRDRTITLPGLGFYGLLLQLDDLSVLGRFADETLGPLRDYDDARKTNLVETLRSYLAHDLSTARTAKALFVHPNTVTLRLKRIESLLGLQLARPESLLQLNAALMAHDIGRVGVDRRT